MYVGLIHPGLQPATTTAAAVVVLVVVVVVVKETIEIRKVEVTSAVVPQVVTTVVKNENNLDKLFKTCTRFSFHLMFVYICVQSQ